MLVSGNNGELFQFEICRIVIGLLVLTSSVFCAYLETPIPEALLKPRNFNHHPYGQSYVNQPLASHHASVNLNGIESDYASQSVYDVDVQNPLPARHPSNGVYSQAPHQFPPTLPPGQNPRNLPPSQFVGVKNNHYDDGIDDNFDLTKKQYAFSYTVRDMHSGDDFSHTQQQKNGAVKGTYKVQLPDGRTQVVRYTADNDGYRADVSYLIDKNAVGYQDGNAINLANNVDHQQQHLIEKVYNPSIFDGNVVAAPVGPAHALHSSPSNPVFVTTGKPPLDLHHAPLLADPDFESNKLNFEERKSISAKPTYVVSAKSTHISDGIRIVPNAAAIDENAIALHHNPGIYFKIQHHQHHPVFYKTH